MPKHKKGIVSADVFSALGDATRLDLVERLATGRRFSISELCSVSTHSRQAVTKHLRVLEGAGIARSKQEGRQVLYELSPGVLNDAAAFLEQVSQRWDQALARLKQFVEDGD